MNAHQFSLHFDLDEKPVVFPIPQTNHYQKITHLQLNSLVSQENIGKETTVGIFPNQATKSILFDQTPHAIDVSLNSVQIVQRKQSEYFSTDTFINSKDSNMHKLAQQWLSEDKAKTANEVLQSLYRRSLLFLQYGNPINGLYSYSEALRDKTTDCGGFSTFLATLLQTQNIPCRLVAGYLYKNSLSLKVRRLLTLPENFQTVTMHAWLEVQTEQGGWFPIDASVSWRREHHLSQRQGGFGQIMADRLVVSFGHNHSFTYQGKQYAFPILQHPEVLKSS